MAANNIHINPSFIPKSQTKIYLNPSFVNVGQLKQSFDTPHAVYTDYSQHPQVGYHFGQESKSNFDYNLSKHKSSGFTDYSTANNFNINTPKNNSILFESSNKPSFASFKSSQRHLSTYSLPTKALANPFKATYCTSEYTPKVKPLEKFPVWNDQILHEKCNRLNNRTKTTVACDRSIKLKAHQENNLKESMSTIKNGFYNSSKYKILNKNFDMKEINNLKRKYSLDKRDIVKSQVDQTVRKVGSAISLTTKETVDQNKNVLVSKINSSLASFKNNKDLPSIKATTVHSSCKANAKTELISTDKSKDSYIMNRCDSINASNFNSSAKRYRMTNVIKPHSKPVPYTSTENPITSNSSTKFNTLCSQSQINDKKPFAFTSKSKLVRNIDPEKLRKRKNSYTIKTKTKLIRKNSTDSKFKKSNVALNASKLKKITPIKRNFIIKSKENKYRRTFGLHRTYRRVSVSEDGTRLRSKYKVVNNAKGTKQISKYRINRTPNSIKTVRASFSPSSSLLAKNKRRNPAKKSDKFINIEGSLYKSTRTSLRKHDSTLKTNKNRDVVTHFKPKGKKHAPQNSKFVYRRQSSTDLESGTLIEIVRRKKLSQFKRVNDHCFFYKKYGHCKKANKGCPFIHDPTRVAVCTRFLRGLCSVKDCPFSHTLDKSKMPVCSHFLEGFCRRESCPYRHVKVNPKAPFCRNFAKGHCPLGEECKNKHILICEEFKEDGVCPRGKSCPLSHRRRKISSSKSGIRRRRSTSSSTSASCSSSFSSSVKKNAKSKKLNARKNAKIGVLGLHFDKTSKLVGPREKGPTPAGGGTTLGRYFDCPEVTPPLENDSSVTGKSAGSEVSKLDGISASETPVGAQSPPTKSGLEEKRERLLKKIEKLKRNYHVGDANSDNLTRTGESGDIMDSPVAVKLESHFPEIKDIPLLVSPVSQPEVSIKLRFRPLPDTLPSFIPLIVPEEEGK